MKKKDGKIELLRFVMTCFVLVYHIYTDGHLPEDTVFFGFLTMAKWSSAVDFFFILSAMLMTKTICKRITEDAQSNLQPEPVGVETAHYILRKAKGLMPYYLFYSLGMIVYDYYYYVDYTTAELLNYYAIRLHSFVFLSGFGLSGHTSAYLGVTWYLSSMLIAMAIVYPLCRKYYKTFTHLIAPLGSMFLIGYMMHVQGDISCGGLAWLGFTYARNLRAITGVMLGTTCYEISRQLALIQPSKSKKFLLTVLEYGCYIGTMLLFMSNVETTPRIYCLALTAIGLTITFSRQSYLTGSKLFDNPFIYYLGAGSYSIYLIQEFTRYLIPDNFPMLSPKKLVLVVFVSTIVLGLLVYEGGQQLKRFLARRKAKTAQVQ